MHLLTANPLVISQTGNETKPHRQIVFQSLVKTLDASSQNL